MNQYEKVKERVDIVDVFSKAGGKISRTNYGNEVMVYCPFHSNRRASMSINKESKLFYCFGCSEKGDVFELLAKMKDISVYESLQLLAKEYFIELDTTVTKRNTKRITELIDIYDDIAVVANECLCDLQNLGYDYLANCGVCKNTMNDLKLGYIGQSLNLYNFMKKKGYSESSLLTSGLFDASKKFVLQNRVLFPVLNMKKQVVMFTGQSINDDMQPKYKYSTNKIVGKSEILYNMQNHHSNQKYKIIVEKPMDSIALFEKRKKNSVALLGKDISSFQCNIISQLSNNIVIWLDNDNRQLVLSAYNSYIEFCNRQVNVKFAFLDTTMDPYDFCYRNNIAQMEKYFIDFGEYFQKTIGTVINTDNLFFKDELQDMFAKYAPYMTKKVKLETKKTLEEMFCCQLQIKDDNIIDEYTLNSIGFMREPNMDDIYVKKIGKYYFYLMVNGNIYRLLNRRVENKFTEYCSLNEEIVINDNQVVIDKNCFRDLSKYIELL